MIKMLIIIILMVLDQDITQVSKALVQEVSNVLPGTTLQFPLVIQAGALLPGVRYTFRLSASSVGGSYMGPSSAEWTIEENQAPRPGYLSVSPARGVALIDMFDLETHNFVDDAEDLPLSYSYYFTDSRGDPSVIDSDSPLNIYCSARLPQVRTH